MIALASTTVLFNMFNFSKRLEIFNMSVKLVKSFAKIFEDQRVIGKRLPGDLVPPF